MAKMAHLDVQLVFVKKGIPGVEDLIEKELCSGHTLRRMLREVREDPGCLAAGLIDDLEALLRKRGFVTGLLQKPDVGDVRPYKIQEEAGRQFLRVPVDYLQQPTGSELQVRFDVNGFRGEIPENREG